MFSYNGKIIIDFINFHKTLHLRFLRGFWICVGVLSKSGFWVFQDCQYARVLNFQGYTGFTYFRKCDRVLNMRWDAITEGFWIFQESEYTRFLHMQALHKVLNMPEYCWIMFIKLLWLWLSSEYAWLKFQSFEYASHCKYARARNRARSWMVTQGTEYAWISLNIP